MVDATVTVAEHDVYEDGAGCGGHYRLTCRSCPESPGTSQVRQPYMNEGQWQEALRQFRVVHPFTTAKRHPGE